MAEGAESACARAMAEAARVLREIAVVAPRTHFALSLARAMPDCLTLDPGLDFVLHDECESPSGSGAIRTTIWSLETPAAGVSASLRLLPDLLPN
jgi:hypothetical protein